MILSNPHASRPFPNSPLPLLSPHPPSFLQRTPFPSSKHSSLPRPFLLPSLSPFSTRQPRFIPAHPLFTSLIRTPSSRLLSFLSALPSPDFHFNLPSMTLG